MPFADKSDEELASWSKRLAALGYRWHVQTLATFRNGGFNTFKYALAVGQEGVAPLGRLQRDEREFAKEFGYEGNLSQAAAGGLVTDYAGLMAGRSPEMLFVAGSTEQTQAGQAPPST